MLNIPFRTNPSSSKQFQFRVTRKRPAPYRAVRYIAINHARYTQYWCGFSTVQCTGTLYLVYTSGTAMTLPVALDLRLPIVILNRASSPTQAAISGWRWGFYSLQRGIVPGHHRFHPHAVGVIGYFTEVFLIRGWDLILPGCSGTSTLPEG